ncbi:MAG: hypothetical protein R6U28_12000 [Cyclonatronaceae bacterium]
MKQKKRKTGSLVIWLGALMVILIVAYFAAVLIMERTSGPVHSETHPPEPAFIHDDEPVIESIVRWHIVENMDMAAINQRLPEPYEVLVLNEDITANQAPDYVVIRGSGDVPELSRVLVDAGYTHRFMNLAVYELRDRRLEPVLLVDGEAIRDEHGRQLIDQVPADHGYALVLGSFENDTLYDAPVTLLEIVMLNEQGREASDDIILYWDPSESAYKATNTFGAP